MLEDRNTMAQKATDQNLSTALEYDWVKVRQSVAERVLTRHLDDLEQRDTSTGRRQRATSVYVANNAVVTTEPGLAATRRRSLPSGPHGGHESPQVHAARSPQRRVDFQPGSPAFIPRSQGFPEEDSTSDILDLMSSTLLQAREVEERRPSLYLRTRSKGASGRDAVPTRRKSYHDRLITLDNPPMRQPQLRHKDDTQLPRHTDGKPALERGKTFIRTEEAQVLSFDDIKDPNDITSSDVTTSDHNGHVAPSDRSPTVSATRRVSQTGDGKPETGKGKELVGDKGKDQQTTGTEQEQSLGPRKKTSTGKSESKASPRPPEEELQGNATVEFYDEYVGFQPTIEKDDGGFTPQSLSLPLKEMKDDTDDEDTNDDDKPEDGSDEEADTLGEGQDSWHQVRKCRYIRGYNPPEMLMPNDTVRFVFNGK